MEVNQAPILPKLNFLQKVTFTHLPHLFMGDFLLLEDSDEHKRVAFVEYLKAYGCCYTVTEVVGDWAGQGVRVLIVLIP